MKSSSEKTNTSVKFKLSFESKDFEPARIKALERLARNTKIAGFRNGKAPANVVEQHVDPNQLASLTLDILIRTTIPKVFEKEKVQPISIPHVDVMKFVPGESAEVEISADIMPEVKLGDYKNLKVEYHQQDIDDSDIEDVLNRIADSMGEPKVVKRAAKNGDSVIIDFTGKKDGVAFKGGSAKDFTLGLGSGQFIPGFEDGIVGHEVGDKFDLKLTFPEDYGNAELAGQPVVFEILVKQISEIIRPEIDDELAKKTGAFATLEELKEDIRHNLNMQANRGAEERFKDELIKALVDSSKTEAPKSLVEEQLGQIRGDFERNLKARGLTREKFLEDSKKKSEDLDKEMQEAAERRVISSIIVQKLADELEIEVDDEAVNKQVAEMREVYKKNAEASEQLNDPQVVAGIRNRMRINATLDKLAEISRPNAKIVKDEKKSAKKPAAKKATAKKADKKSK